MRILKKKEYDKYHNRESMELPTYEGPVLITPQGAKVILESANTHNRKMKDSNKTIATEINAGQWVVNGETIKFDWNGVLVDGQHRLSACILANKPIVTGIVHGLDPAAFTTVDTGVGRSLADILHTEGFTNVNILGGVIRIINKINKGAHTIGRSQSNSRTKSHNRTTNAEGLKYAYKHREALYDLMSKAYKIYYKQNKYLRLMAIKDISAFLYLLAGKSYNVQEQHIGYMMRVCGVIVDPDSGVNWLYRRLVKTKETGESSLSREWLTYMIIKTWNNYIDGDAKVRGYKYVSGKMPKPLQAPHQPLAV